MKYIGMFLGLIALATMTAAPAVAGPKWDVGEDGWMQLSFLGQVHYAHEDNATVEDDIYLRRGRFILAGQIQDGVKFFAETDNDNAGKSGTSVSTDIQDIFMDIRLLQSDNWEHWAKMGLILLPFSFENRASATSILGIDYNASCIKLANTFVWRDYGAELHGNFGDRVSYCAGVFDGYDSSTGNKNPDADLRLTGHMAVNLIGKAETGWFYSQERLPKESYLSLGMGADMQDKATITIPEADEGSATTPAPIIDDSEAWVADIQSGFVLGDGISLTVNGAYYDWDNVSFKGNTMSAETGLLVGKTMLTGKIEQQDPDAGEKIEDYTAGVHYFMKGHNARGGVEYRWGDSEDKVLAGIQFLL